MSSLDYLDLCRLCLVKDRVSVPIFEGEGDVRQIFLKIAACLPVKVGREDKLPKKICDDCVYKVELFYQFWNTTANAEKQLLQWLGEVSLDEKQGYVTGAHNPVNDHTNTMGMGMGMLDGMGMPMMLPNSGQQQMTSVPMDTGGNAVQPGPSAQSHDQQKSTTNQDDEEDESEEEDNSDDECDGDDGLPVKEESEDDPSSSRTIEPTTFVNVSLACDEAGPSGLQQQKINEMPEMVMTSTDGDPKSGQFKERPRNARGRFTRVEKFSSSVEEKNPFLEVMLNAEDMFSYEPPVNSPTIGKLRVKKMSQLGIKEEPPNFDETIDENFRRPLYCKICPRIFDHDEDLKNHVKEEHETRKKETLHRCTKCDYTTKVKSNLKPHYIRKHTNDFRYACEHCGKRFKLEWDLIFHRGTHGK